MMIPITFFADSFTASNLSGLTFWPKGDAMGLNDGDLIATAGDHSGAGNDVTQATEGNKPSFQTGEVNGLPVMRFAGDDFLEGPPLSDIIQNNVFTLWIVFRIAAFHSDEADSYLNDLVIGDAEGYWGLHLRSSQGIRFYQWDGADKHVSVAATTGVWYVARVRFESGTLYMSVNGGPEVSIASGNIENIASNLRLGKSNYSSGFDGDIAEPVICASAQTSEHLAQMDAYLNSKYAVY
jgi:hypothetical protein